MDDRIDDILTVDEVANLEIPRSSVYKLAQQGKIPAKKVGRHWRFHRATLVNWITGQNYADQVSLGTEGHDRL